MPTEKDSPKASLEKERAEQKHKSEKAEQEDYLEEALKETFPASDPIAPGDPKEHAHGRKVVPEGDKR
jgi:hypothetical protein